MQEVRIDEDHLSGTSLLVIRESETHVRFIPLDCIPAYSEYLGIPDAVETVEAICAIQDVRAEDEEKDATRDHNIWTDSYRLLQHREQAREHELIELEVQKLSAEKVNEAIEKSTQAAHQAVHIPGSDGECPIDRCRRDIRQEFGIPEPTGKCTAESRLKKTTAQATRGNKDRSMIKAAIDPVLPMLDGYRQDFLHGLASGNLDTLRGEESPEGSEPIAEIIAKYSDQEDES